MTKSASRRVADGGTMRFHRPLFENLDGLMTYEELSKVLGVAKRTLRLWVSQGKIPYRRIGYRTLRFAKADISVWLQNKGA